LIAFELRHLRYFVSLAEDLHFGRAAARLGIAQPSLSQQIRALETAVGVTLLARTSRAVQLTDGGRAFLEGARRTLGEAERSAREANAAARGHRGALRIGYTDSAALSILPQLLSAFRAAHADVELILGEASTEAQVRSLLADQADVVLVRAPVLHRDLRVDIVHSEEFVVAVPAGHPLAGRRRVALARVASEPMVLFPRRLAPEFHDSIIGMCQRAGFSPRVVHEAGEYQTITSLVAAGLGVSIVPRSIENLGRRGVAYVRLGDAKVAAEVALVTHPGRGGTLVEEFRGFAVALLRSPSRKP
jgi:DNA-binding transcriptional LysR family regulator